METNRFTKLDENLSPLPNDAPQWVAVLDNTTNLIWSAANIGDKSMTHAKAVEACTDLDLAGKPDWRLPIVEELFCLADRSRYSPAINTDFFPDTKSDWYWSASPYAYDSDYAWFVSFHYGHPHWYNRYHKAFVRAVRSASQ